MDDHDTVRSRNFRAMSLDHVLQDSTFGDLPIGEYRIKSFVVGIMKDHVMSTDLQCLYNSIGNRPIEAGRAWMCDNNQYIHSHPVRRRL
jgi:hypothetical protein